jgi:antitoxin component YwqK of YwqJK toxin-antitoxin module
MFVNRKYYMRKFKFLLLLLSAVFFLSCGKVEVTNGYRVASDGLLYFKGTEKLYSGTISDSSSMIMHYEVVDGKKNGSFLVYYRNGNLAQSGYIIDNRNEGEWRYYYVHGELESRGMYAKDKPQGEWRFYHPDGSLKSYGTFKDGLRHGRWIQYDENGEVLNIYIFSYGKFIDTQIKHS